MFASSRPLPDHCLPSNEFLTSISRVFNTCIPSPLALLSTLLGICSILSWLFAQLPQIIKNFQLHSTSGLSIFFLTEWLLGDASNLFGSIFTQQASWQVVLATYYCCVDCVLVGQWIWYEHLKHGRVVRKVRWWTWSRGAEDTAGAESRRAKKKPRLLVDGVPVRQVPSQSKPITANKKIPHSADEISESESSSFKPSSLFRVPKFSFSYSSVSSTLASSPTGSTQPRPILRPPRPESPTPSPRTVLYITLILAIVAHGSPVTHHPALPSFYKVSSTNELSSTEILGRILSWLSTLLYLGSRLPQLLHNYTRRSTEGLSPTLFLAAFFGNLFYSSSLLTNPSLWADMPAYGGGGWVGSEGSLRGPWAIRATPFFLGAAGVLFMDAMVGAQFLMYAQSSNDTARVLVVEEEGVRGAGRWRRVSGWMRGWVPVAASKKKRGLLARDPFESETDAETESLLSAGWESPGVRTPRGDAASVRSYGAVGR